MERLVGIDVPDAGDQRLVEQRGLHVTHAVAQPVNGRALRVKPVRPELAVPSLMHRADVFVRDDPAEPPRVTEHEEARTAPRERPRDVAMRHGCVGRDEQLARHAQLHHERPAVVDDDGELLPAPFERCDAASDEELAAELQRRGWIVVEP